MYVSPLQYDVGNSFKHLVVISTSPRHSSPPDRRPSSHKLRHVYLESSLHSGCPPRICLFPSHPHVVGSHRIGWGRFPSEHSWCLECRLDIQHTPSASRWGRLVWHTRSMGWCLGRSVFLSSFRHTNSNSLSSNSEAFIYSTTTGHPAFSSFSNYVSLLFSSPLLPIPRKPHADSDFPPLNALGAKSIAAAVLGIFFAARVIHMHWLTPNVSPPKVVGVGSAGKKPKKKIQ